MNTVQCGDGCKREQPDDEEAVRVGWRFLDFARKWRCPQCAQDLAEANERQRLHKETGVGLTGLLRVHGPTLIRGAVIRHEPSGRVYRVESTGGKLRLPSGGWVSAARYVPAAPVPHERLDVEYYRPLDDFGSFVYWEG